MAHFAQIDGNNIVAQVIVADQDTINTGLFGDPASWIQTSYNTHGGVHTQGGTPLRKNYAVVGGLYDPIKDAFYVKQPHPSWLLNEETCLWQAPVPFPTDESKLWKWDETSLNWIETTSISEALGN